MLVNAQGRLVERVGVCAPELVRQEPTAGNDITSAIDERVQRTAEEALAGQRAAVVAIDPRNGDVVAYVSTPTFDPNGFARGLTSPNTRRCRTTSTGRWSIARCVASTRRARPSSRSWRWRRSRTTSIAPEATRVCRGAFQLPGSSHRFRDWKKGGHGTVDMHRAIAQSCDVYF